MRAKIEICDVLLARHRLLFLKLMELKKELDGSSGIKRRDKLNEFWRLMGEIDSLRWACDAIAALSKSGKA